MPNLAATTREPDSTVAAADPDFPGLSFAYRFRDGSAEPLTARDIPGALVEPGGWIWIHLSLTDTFARDWIAHTAPLPERARQILLSDDDHQLLEPIDGGVAGVFADLLREFAGESRELGRLHFALTDTLVVSGRRAALGAIQRTLDALGKGKKLPDAITLLEEIVSHFADAVALVAQELSDTLDTIEESLIDEVSGDERRRLGPARRTAVRMHRQLSTLRLLFRRWSTPDEGTSSTRIGLTSGRLAQRLDGLGSRDRRHPGARPAAAGRNRRQARRRNQPPSIRAHRADRLPAAADTDLRHLRHERFRPALHQRRRRLHLGHGPDRVLGRGGLRRHAVVAHHAVIRRAHHNPASGAKPIAIVPRFRAT
jgi:zinc transporter